MHKIMNVLGILLMLVGKAYAADGDTCYLSPLTGGGPYTANIQAQVITIDASQVASTAAPIATYDAPPQGYDQGYYHCKQGTPYGRSPFGVLTTQDIATHIYKTSLDGIGIKVLWNNGTSSTFGNVPSQGSMCKASDLVCDFVYQSGSRFRIEFYKTMDNLSLQDPLGDEVLPAGQIAYFWQQIDSPASYTQQLFIGRITLVSTPSCSYSQTQVVDFQTVTSNTLTTTGIEKPLNFNINCRTDYGSYTAKATLATLSPSADGSYIKVRDSSGNQDRMGIKIRDGQGKAMKVDGSASESMANISSTFPAQFHWTATLVPVGSTPPADGNFTANAEIILQLP